MPRVPLALQSGDDTEVRTVVIDKLVIAGWTGRDPVALEAHIEELARLGVRRPQTTPSFYEIAADRLNFSEHIEVVGQGSTGEAECVYLQLEDGLWLGLGSDHTDRDLEAVGIAVAKQVCPKPVAAVFWRFTEICNHFDALVLRSWATIGGIRTLYQEGRVSSMRRPEELLDKWSGDGRVMSPGSVMFGGTLPACCEIEFATTFEMELEDPIRRRRIRRKYEVGSLQPAG
jgi:Protein of unknown function (DUF2848)